MVEGGADHAPATADRVALFAALGELPPRHRAVVILRYYHDYDYATIARILGTTPTNVGAMLSRARDRLKLELEPTARHGGRAGGGRRCTLTRYSTVSWRGSSAPSSTRSRDPTRPGRTRPRHDGSPHPADAPPTLAPPAPRGRGGAGGRRSVRRRPHRQSTTGPGRRHPQRMGGLRQVDQAGIHLVREGVAAFPITPVAKGSVVEACPAFSRTVVASRTDGPRGAGTSGTTMPRWSSPMSTPMAASSSRSMSGSMG